MRPRIAFARFLLRAGDFLRTLPVVVLRPADMIEWSRQGYERSGRYFATANDVDAGLTHDELELWERLPVHTGHVLILGVGGGREAVWFGRHDWHVTGLDFSGQMLEQARESMAQRQFAFDGWIGDIACLEVQRESQDLIWTSMFLYSAVINRERRVKMLKLIYNALKPGGTLVVSFHWQPNAQHPTKYFRIQKMLAWLTLGNTGFENGDILFGTLEFRHAFSSEQKLREEFIAGGFAMPDIDVIIFDKMMRGGAILRKSELGKQQGQNKFSVEGERF